MIETFDKSEIAMMERYEKLKREYDEGVLKRVAKEEGLAEGRAEGKAEGKIEGMKEHEVLTIKTMAKNGASNEMIAKLLNLDISYVDEVLSKSN